jgi:hypothetical protein
MEILNFTEFKRSFLFEAEGDAEDNAAVSEPIAPAEPAAPAPIADDTMAPPVTSSGIPPAPTDPAAMALPPDPNAPQVSSGNGITKLIFLETDKKWHSQYTDGGGVRRYVEYELTPTEIDKFIADNNLTDKRDDILQAMQGKKSMDAAAYDKLKNAVASSKLGKDRGELDVDYDSKGIPSTGQLDVIFIKKS